MKVLFTLSLLLIICIRSVAQEVFSLDSALANALRSHPQMQLSRQEVDQQKALKKGSFSLDNPELLLSGPDGSRLVGGVLQRFNAPTVYHQQAKVARQTIDLAEKSLLVNEATLIRDVRLAYLNLQFAQVRVGQLAYQDSIFNRLSLAGARRYTSGEGDMLEKVSAETRSREMQHLLRQSKADLANAKAQLLLITGKTSSDIVADPLQADKVHNLPAEIKDTAAVQKATILQYYRQHISVREQMLKLERAKLFPGIILGYQNQSTPDSKILPRFQFGLTVPLWFWTYTAQIKSAGIGVKMAQSQYGLAQLNTHSEYQQALANYQKFSESLAYYTQSALQQADLIIITATRSYQAGETDYVAYVQGLMQAFTIRLEYYQTLRDYHQSIIHLNYLQGGL